MKRAVLVLIIILSFTYAWFFLAGRTNIHKRPNVIIILSDALRRDHLGCYGYPRNTSPNIDAFAKEATVFKNAFSQSSYTAASVSSIFTSKYPSQHGAKILSAPNPEYLTLAELLKERGYWTVCFTENAGRPLDIMKLVYEGFTEIIVREVGKESKNKESLVELISNWLRKNKKSPFFMYIHLIEPHMNSKTPIPTEYVDIFKGEIVDLQTIMSHSNETMTIGKVERDRIQEMFNLYDSRVRFLDSKFKKVIDGLEASGLLDNSVVIFTSDHGERLNERLVKFGLLHGLSVSAEEINIPLIIRYPPLFRKGYYLEDYAQHIDILPTIADILDIDIRLLFPEGHSLLGESNKDVRVFCEILEVPEGANPQQCVIFKEWKLIHKLNSNEFFMFNIKDDPYEKNNAIREYPDIAKEMKNILSGKLDNLKDKKLPRKTTPSEEDIESLRSLGYLQ